jgi:hypothetical protein
MNPFDAGVLEADCIHAIMDKRIAMKKSRKVDGVKRFFFYNPMWNFFGDEIGSPGTYYYDRSGRQKNYYWNMFDQVLIRPGLINFWDSQKLAIVTKAGVFDLLKPSGIPDKKMYSDHLPIVFNLNL